MNIFSLTQIITYIKRNFKVYFCIVFQFAIAVILLNMFLSLYFNIKKEQSDLDELGKNQEYAIEASSLSFDIEQFDLMKWGNEETVLNEDDSIPFSEDCIEKIKEQYKDYVFNLKVTVDLFYLGQYAEDGEDPLKIVYSSDCETVKMDKETEKKLLDVSHETTINCRDFPHTVSGGHLKTIQGDEYDIDYVEDSEGMILLPYSAYSGLFHKKDLGNLTFSIKPAKNKNVTAEILSSIIRILEEENNNLYKFNISNEAIDYLLTVHQANKEAKCFTLICEILIILVVIGGIGVFSLVLDRRKKEIAICYALGECKSQLYMKSILEISILLFSAYIIGMIVSQIFICMGISVATVEVKQNWKAGICLFGMVIFVIIITVIPVIRLIKKYSPIKILSTL